VAGEDKRDLIRDVQRIRQLMTAESTPEKTQEKYAYCEVRKYWV